VLVERQTETGYYIGLSDNYIEVVFKSPRDLRGEFIQVRVDGIKAGQAEGSICNRD